MQKQNKLTNYNPSVCAWKLQSYILQIVLIKQQRNQTWQSKNCKKIKGKNWRLTLQNQFSWNLEPKESRFPKVERSKSLKVVAKAFEEPNMHKHDAKNA